MASRTALLPRKANDRFDTPPEVSAPGRLSLIQLTAFMKSTAYRACSRMPVPTASTLTSKMMSCGCMPTCLVSKRYAREHISIFLSYVVACPFSSNAMTTIAAPRRRISLALSRKAASPSFRLIELTIDLPCAFFSPARIVSQWDESSISAARATAGSPDTCRTKVCISLVLSSMASSMLMSMMSAPPSICPAAMRRPSA